MLIFFDIAKDTIEVFMDDFLVIGDSFDNYLAYFPNKLQTCEEYNLVLNWEKYHYMVKKGIILGHKISKWGIEMDRAKIEVIENYLHQSK